MSQLLMPQQAPAVDGEGDRAWQDQVGPRDQDRGQAGCQEGRTEEGGAQEGRGAQEEG